jgi:outer membrane protein W
MSRLIKAGPRACATTSGLRVCAAVAVTALVLGVIAAPVASAQQSLSFSVGGFSPRSEDARTSSDVLVHNLDFLAFNIKDFSGPTVGAEWLVALGDKFEAGLGAGFYTRSVPTVYLNFVNTNGSEIDQTLKLRVVPFSATVRFLPLGHHNGIEPYIGAGVGVFNYRYSESGQFLATDSSIFRGTFIGSGTATGPVILGGVRVPVGSWGIGGELRYQSAEGTLPSDQDFAGSKLDLGGITYSFTVNVRF